MQHPYLFFSAADVKAYKLKIASDADAAKRYEAAISKVEEYLSEELITEERCNGNSVSQHADFGLLNNQANRFAYALGTKYIVDGDRRCAEKLRQLLVTFNSFERWYSLSYKNRKPVPWHSDLCSTATTLAMAKIFDLIYDYLSEAERKSIAEGILENGVYPTLADWVMPETRIHAIDSMGHNWWAVCISEASIALLVLSDYVPEAERRERFRLIDNALAQYMTYPGNKLFNKFGNFDDRGLFYESVGYNDFGTGSLLRYLWCNERYFGRNNVIRSALPEGLCDAVIELSYPYTENGTTKYGFLNFGDSDFDRDISLMTKYAVRLGVDSSALRAVASTYKTDLWEEIGGFDTSKLVGSVDALPKTMLFSSGFAVTRGSWSADDTLFAVKSGYCWNHSHNDSGSFVIFSNGRPLFIDSGTCNYDSPLYHDYYCQDVAHSVLKIGGKGRRDEELYRGTKFRGELTDSFENEEFFFVQADSAGPMAHLCSRMFRNFLWIDNRLLVIIDEVYCHEEDTVEMTLHFDGEYTAENGIIEIDNSLSKARVISHEPPDMIQSVNIGHPDHAEKEEKSYIVLTTPEKKRAHVLIHTIELEPEKRNMIFERLESENAVGLRVTDGGIEREIWFNIMADGHVMHDNSCNVIAGYETDAYVLVLTRNKEQHTEKVFAVSCSYLRRDGKAFIGSFTKGTGEVVVSL